MSEQNTQHRQIGLDRMLQQFQGSDLQTLAGTFLDQVQTLEDALYPLLSERSLDNATGHRLDGIGQLFNVERGGRSDSDYRAALKVEAAVLQSDGTAETLIDLVQLIVGMTTADYEVLEFYPKHFYIRPVDWALTVDPVFVGSQTKRAGPGATQISFVYSLFDDDSTIKLSSSASSEFTGGAGLATGPGTTGHWTYDENVGTGGGFNNGEIRFNAYPPTDATIMRVMEIDDDSTDQSTNLTALDGRGCWVIGAAGGWYMDIVSQVDQGAYRDFTITNIVEGGTRPVAGEDLYVYDTATGGYLSGVEP